MKIRRAGENIVNYICGFILILIIGFLMGLFCDLYFISKKRIQAINQTRLLQQIKYYPGPMAYSRAIDPNKDNIIVYGPILLTFLDPNSLDPNCIFARF